MIVVFTHEVWIACDSAKLFGFVEDLVLVVMHVNYWGLDATRFGGHRAPSDIDWTLYGLVCNNRHHLRMIVSFS